MTSPRRSTHGSSAPMQRNCDVDDDFDLEQDLDDVRIDVNDDRFAAPDEEHQDDNDGESSNNPRVDESSREGYQSNTSASQRSQLSAQERAALDQQLIHSARQQHQDQQRSDVSLSRFAAAPPRRHVRRKGRTRQDSPGADDMRIWTDCATNPWHCTWRRLGSRSAQQWRR